METSHFVPKLPVKSDKLAQTLLKISQILVVLSVVAAPVFFIPGVLAGTAFPKIFLSLIALLFAVVMLSFSILRSGSLTLRMSPVILVWWGIVLAGLISSLLSPTLMPSLFGDVLEVQTVGFLAFLGVLMSMSLVLHTSKRGILAVYGSLFLSAAALSLYFISRVIFGAGFLNLGSFGNLSNTPMGSFNDLGIFVGLVVIISMVALVQLTLPKRGLAIIGGVLFLSLLVLISVNFFFVWVIIALLGLALLMYSLTKDRFGVPADSLVHHEPMSVYVIVMIGLVFLISTLFLIGGNSFGTMVSNVTGINYVEIRPSITATTDILRQVYSDNALTGVGPNNFDDAWSLYKDQSINSTYFWSTNFEAGSGYVPTWFVTTGILGVIAWLAFLGAFLFTGVKMLLKSRTSDTFWYLTGTVSFISAAYVWFLAFVYVPGPVILMIGAVSTGIMVLAGQMLLPQEKNKYNLLTNSRTGFVLILVVMIFVIGTIATGYGAVRQMTAAYTYYTANLNIPEDTINPFDIITNKILQAYNLYQSDTYARAAATYQLGLVNNLLSITDPTAEQQQQFQNAFTNSVNFATQAVSDKQTDPRNWQLLGDIYANLAVLKKEGAKEAAFKAYSSAEAVDPKNPYYVLQKAGVEFQTDNADEARRLAVLALELKPNYTDALYLVSQIDVAKGDIPKAIATTEAIIYLDSSNPGRYYQLGILYAANKQVDDAIAAFSAALQLNSTYANAMYLRAQQYLIKGEKELAVKDLEKVRDLNPDNTTLTDIIDKIKSGEISADTVTNQTISESNNVSVDQEVVTSNKAPETDLLVPVNPVKNETPAEAGTNTPAPVE